MRRAKRRAGYTLIETMLAVGILGMLTALAVVEWTSQVQRSYRAEAHFGLNALRTLQVAYFMDNEAFAADFPSLAFEIPGGREISPTKYQGRRYTYDLYRPWGPLSYYGVASANLDGDPWPDLVISVDRRD